MKKIFLLPFLLLSVIFAAAADKPAYTSEGKELGNVPAMPLVITTGLNGNPVKCGEKVTFTVIPATPPENAAKIRIFKWLNGIKKETGEYPIKKFTVTMDSAVPAHIMVTGVYIDANGKEISPPPQTAGYGDGVFVAPEKLQKARKRPADFDEFWDNELKKLAAIPMKVKRKLYRQNDLIRCEEVEINSVAGIPVTGFLVIPQKAAPKSLPAVIYFHGAGFKSSSVHEEYKDRAIVFDVNAHGIKNGMPREFYKQLNRKPPADRNVFNHRNDRQKSYFKNMFLRTVRAIEFVKTLPEWDGKTIIVSGRSQGGAQAIAAAALSQDVTLCIANVPALADHGAGEVNRAPGWPGINAKKDPAIAAASDYVDIINLASRIKCETIMSIGMIDAICPPISVWLTYQELKVKKDITLFPRLGHIAPPWKFDGRERIKEEISK